MDTFINRREKTHRIGNRYISVLIPLKYYQLLFQIEALGGAV